ncbi:penicillin-binding protein [Persicitalea sp.]|uniref:penicillin-binding protein n=1 Tax=Persicitalea sp. TaxID=3100273 RepID=UPI003592FBCC
MKKSTTNEKQALMNRAYVVAVVLMLLSVVVAGRLVWIQYFAVFQDKTWGERAAASNMRMDTVQAMRGNIYANDGSLLATSIPYYFVELDAKYPDSTYFADHLDALSDSLAQVFGRRTRNGYRAMIRRTRDGKSSTLRLHNRAVSYRTRERIMSWPFFRRGDDKLEDANGKLKYRKTMAGKFTTEYRRYRPFSPMADRTVGTVDSETGRGRVGLEASFNRQLAGTNGANWVQVLPRGVRLPVSDEFNLRPETGSDIHTTLDINFQDVAESSLKKALEKYQANYGCVIVMEVATGKIKALSNLTRKGPNRFVDDRNYALAMGADPGSTFKLATMMAVLEETGIDPDKVWVNAGSGRLVYRGLAINDAHRGGFGSLTASQVLEKSSNIGTHLLMQKYFYSQPDKYLAYLEKFRLKNRTGIHMQGEAAPFIRDRNSKLWGKTSLTPMSYGYDMRLAPIQILALYNAVANQGYWVRPMIVEQVRSSSEIVNTYEPYVTSSPICSERTIKLVQGMLEGVVQRGTAPGLKASPYRVAGKTGTAQKIVNGKYMARRGLRVSFVGYFPADRPKYSCMVLVDNSLAGGSDLYAGEVAAPVFKQVADRIYAYDLSLHAPAPLDPVGDPSPIKWTGRADEVDVMAKVLNLSTPPEPATDSGGMSADSNRWVQGSTAGEGKTKWATRPVDKAEVPDLRGMPLRDALYIMENKGFRVGFKGSGKVVTQSLEPGVSVSGAKRIMLGLK